MATLAMAIRGEVDPQILQLIQLAAQITDDYIASLGHAPFTQGPELTVNHRTNVIDALLTLIHDPVTRAA